MRVFNTKLPAGWKLQATVFFGSLYVIYAFTTVRLSVPDLPKFYLLLFALYLFNQKPKLKINIDWCISLLLITIVAVAASSMSKFQFLSFSRLAIYRDLFLFSFSIYLILQVDLTKLSNAILAAIVCAFLLVAPLTLIEYFDFSKAAEVNDSRYISPKLSYYSHIRHFSYQAFIASCCAAIIYFNFPKFKYLSGVVCLVCVSMLIASTGRAAILAFMMFITGCSLMLYDTRKALKLGSLFLALTIGLLLLLSLTPYSSLTSSIVERTAQLGSIDQILSGRLSFWRGALRSVFESPLLGLGPNGFRWSEGAIPPAIQPHSSLIQLIVEYGWLGGSIILYRCWLFFAPLCRDLRSNNINERYRLCLVAFFLSYLLFSLVDGLFYHVLPMLHLAILIPLLFALTEQQYIKEGPT